MGKKERKQKQVPPKEDDAKKSFSSLGRGMGFISLFFLFTVFIQAQKNNVEDSSSNTTTTTLPPLEVLEVHEETTGECTIDPASGSNTCESNEPSDCLDSHEKCSFWAQHGECDNNPNYMLNNCQKSCHSCDRTLADPKESITFNDDWMVATKAFGEQQQIDGKEIQKTIEIIEQSVKYMQNLEEDKSHGISQKVLDSCLNRHDLCSFWAAIGECEVNPGYMITNCAPSCFSCDKIDFETRCPPRTTNPEKYVPGLLPGGLNTMFDNIIEEGRSDMTNYTVDIHMGPKSFTSKWDEDAEIPDGPWVVTFDNFLSDEECDRLIQLGYETKDGYQRSLDVGEVKFDGSFDGMESKTRTSANAWCSEKCRDDPTASVVMERLANVAGIPSRNSEDFQLLNYDVGQFYREHHDYIELQKDRQCGPRILTFFLYLSEVEAGGGTAFPTLNNLTVVPKKGRALLWPSVLDENPLESDGRTRHEALTVWAGKKYAANAWIHLFDYLTPQGTGCT